MKKYGHLVITGIALNIVECTRLSETAKGELKEIMETVCANPTEQITIELWTRVGLLGTKIKTHTKVFGSYVNMANEKLAYELGMLYLNPEYPALGAMVAL